MIWIEVRDLSKEVDTKENFRLSRLLWSPSHKNSKSKGKWPFWEALLKVKKGDLIIHLVRDGGKDSGESKFIGHSVVAEKGYIVQMPAPHSSYEYCNIFYKVPLESYKEFNSPIYLRDIFKSSNELLISYYDKNNNKKNKENLFFCRKKNGLQILQGAYLSNIDEELFHILFSENNDMYIAESSFTYGNTTYKENKNSISESIRDMKTRIGQQKFSLQVKQNFNFECCFPDCQFNEERHIVGAHIVRWSDDVQARRDFRNGLSLCKIHDADFELGVFTLDQQYRIRVNNSKFETKNNNSWITKNLLPYEYKMIKQCHELPDIDYIKRHWDRIDFSPD